MTRCPLLMCLLVVALVAVIVPMAAHGQMMDTKRVEVDDKPFLVRVPLARATAAAVSDVAGVLALGCAPAKPQINLYHLNDQGLPGDKPFASFDLPRPAELPEDRETTPLSMVFHPRVPLLYIWQRTARPRDDDEKWDAVYDRCHPLVMVKIDGDKAGEAQVVELGERVDEGNPVGFIALDRGARRLYVPNLRQPRKVKGDERLIPGVGYLELDESGLVVMREGKPALHATFANVFSRDQIAGGFVPVSDERVIIAGMYGPLGWNLADIGQQFHVFYTWPPRYNRRIAGHPNQQVVYMSADEQGYIYCFLHVEGIVTLLPQIAAVSGPYAPPLLMLGQKKVAFGGANVVTYYHIADDGRFTGEYSAAAVSNPRVQALAFSDRFQKLYVPETPR